MIIIIATVILTAFGYTQFPAIKQFFASSRELPVRDPFAPHEEEEKVAHHSDEGPVLNKSIKVSNHGKYLMYTATQFD